MLNYKLSLLAKITGGTLSGKDIPFKSVSIDSRNLEADALFIAIKGENFDGHDFALEAEKKGATALLTQKKLDSQLPQVIVKDTKIALGKLGAYHRAQFKNPILGLTGSFGKTTTKALIAGILKTKFQVLSPEGSMNNDIGVPLTLLKLDQQDFAVIEMGTNHFGEIEYLANLTQPDAALITVIGSAHLEFLKDLKGVAKEKSAIFKGLKPDGYACINLDDPYTESFADLLKDKNIVTFGNDEKAMVRAENIMLNDKAQATFTLITSKFSGEIKLNCVGIHNVKNALAAVAMTLPYLDDFASVKAGLESVDAVNKRLKLRSGLNGSTIIDDCYSAIPEAVSAALQVLCCAKGKKVFIFGGMAELQPDKIIEIHHHIGEEAKALGVDELITLGERAKHTAQAFGSGRCFDDKPALIEYSKSLLAENVTLLVKGSRGMRLEEVVTQLVQE